MIILNKSGNSIDGSYEYDTAIFCKQNTLLMVVGKRIRCLHKKDGPHKLYPIIRTRQWQKEGEANAYMSRGIARCKSNSSPVFLVFYNPKYNKEMAIDFCDTFHNIARKNSKPNFAN